MLEPSPRLKLMADKLYDQVQRGFIENEWEIKFIMDIRNRLKVMTLTAKQIEKLEDLFERN